jgi:hypothetical protein
MTNRQKLIDRLKGDIPKGIKEELEYHMNLDDRDYEYDLADAFFDIYDKAECNDDKMVVNACRKILIEVGRYRVMTQKEINNTLIIGRGSRKVWDFKLKGVPYTFDGANCEWIEGEAK